MGAKNNIFQICILAATLSSISACSTYPSKFKCGDAKGLGCTMVRDIDIKIDSGEIEIAYDKSRQNKQCKNCISKVPSSDTGLLAGSSKSKAKLYKVSDNSKKDDYINF